MGSKIALTLTLTLSLLTLSLANKGKIAVYWGQDAGDGSLASTCETGNYEIVFLGFLKTFGCARNPVLDLDAHCGVQTTGISCATLLTDIQRCQSKGVKVLLALGGPSPTGSYSICSQTDAKLVANYLYDNFLSGAASGPLGNVILDGIHFDIQTGSKLNWEYLLQELYNIRNLHRISFELSAAPQCFLPDIYLDTAIKTGYFDYIFVRFYNSPTCQYSASGDASSLINAWIAWNSYVQPSTKLFLELPAASDAAPNGGYIPPSNLPLVLPYIRTSSNYAGVALWDRSRDVKTLYSVEIKRQLSHPTNTLLASVTDADALLY